MEEQGKKKNSDVFHPVMIFYVKTTIWVAVPAIIAFFVSSYFDLKQSVFFATIAVAFFITIYGIYKEIKDYKETLK